MGEWIAGGVAAVVMVALNVADIVLNRSRRPNPPVPEPSEGEK